MTTSHLSPGRFRCGWNKVLALGVLAFALQAPSASAQLSPLNSALAYWGFEGNLSTTTSPLITLEDVEAAGSAPATPSYSPVSIPAENAGSQAFAFSGTDALRTSASSLRLTGDVTYWVRVNLGSLPSAGALITLAGRTRPQDGLRGIGLQTDSTGRLNAVVAQGGGAYTNIMMDPTAFRITAGTWYDISLRFDAGNILRVDVYNPATGLSLNSFQLTTGVATGISSSAPGYTQFGSAFSGSVGSVNLATAGTFIESAAIWDSYLSDSDLQKLSSVAAVPEPTSVALLISGFLVLLLFRRRKTA